MQELDEDAKLESKLIAILRRMSRERSSTFIESYRPSRRTSSLPQARQNHGEDALPLSPCIDNDSCTRKQVISGQRSHTDTSCQLLFGRKRLPSRKNWPGAPTFRRTSFALSLFTLSTITPTTSVASYSEMLALLARNGAMPLRPSSLPKSRYTRTGEHTILVKSFSTKTRRVW